MTFDADPVGTGGTVINTFLRRCLTMTAGAAVLLAAGVPGAVLLALAAALVCVAMHVAMGHGDAHGEDLLRTAQAAAVKQADRTVDQASQVR